MTERSGDAPAATSCCGPARRCVFAKALHARSTACALSARQSEGELMHVVCTEPAARQRCATFASLLHERSRFALRLPAPGTVLLHVQALRLQCGGLDALRVLVGEGPPDVNRDVERAVARYDDLAQLPWNVIVGAVVAWQPPRRGRARP
jgi:hypothetical protein